MAIKRYAYLKVPTVAARQEAIRAIYAAGWTYHGSSFETVLNSDVIKAEWANHIYENDQDHTIFFGQSPETEGYDRSKHYRITPANSLQHFIDHITKS